jgi:serine protease Do
VIPRGQKIASIIVTFFILITGSVAIYFVDKKLRNPVVKAQSQLGQAAETKATGDKKELKQIIHENQKKVVSIEVEFPDGKGQGSGFLYNDKGDIITNAHVVSGGKNIRVKMYDTSIYTGTVIGMSTEKDVAVVRVSALAGKEPMKIAREKKAEIGDPVIAFGSPHGLENTVTTGIISGVDRYFTIEDTKYTGVYQISAPIAHGNSGGPLVLQNTGEAIGINSAGGTEGNIGFSIPLYQVMPMIEGWSRNPDEKLASGLSSSSEEHLTDYTEEALEEDAQYLVQYFYNSLNSGDYVTAYALLGSDWQSSLSYEKFREGYLHTLNVRVQDTTVRSGASSTAQVTAMIEAEENVGGENRLSLYKTTYTVGLENGVLKLLKGKAEKVESR